jgi:hypothetical protein
MALLAEAHVNTSTTGTTTVPAAQHDSLLVAVMQQPDGSDEFAIALQLLQNNIVALCIRAGAPVTQLWPAEAVLLNLHVLNEFCQQQAMGGSTSAGD